MSYGPENVGSQLALASQLPGTIRSPLGRATRKFLVVFSGTIAVEEDGLCHFPALRRHWRAAARIFDVAAAVHLAPPYPP